MRDRNYFIGCLLQVITHTSLTQNSHKCVFTTLYDRAVLHHSHKTHTNCLRKNVKAKKKTTQTASLRGFLAGAVRIELTTRGFGGGELNIKKCLFYVIYFG